MAGAIDEGAGKYVVIAHSSKSVPKFRERNRYQCPYAPVELTDAEPRSLSREISQLGQVR